MHGIIPEHKKYLTIGIPSIDRPKQKYLHKTLKSLVVNLDNGDKNNVIIIVLIADTDHHLQVKRANETMLHFLQEVKSGLILLIQSVSDFYPDTRIIRRTFNDSLDRVKWRSKQVLDFAFLFSCAQDISEYFLILEDDVEASKHYMRAIRNFIHAKEGQDWVSLTFSGFFIIGRLLKNEILKRLSDFLIMFHVEKPVDLLIMQFLDLLVQNKYLVTRRIPGLFQHIGLFSSLEGKIQKAKDRSFAPAGYFSNPPADVVTTLGVYKNNFPEFCYIPSNKFFWGSAPKVNDTFDIILHQHIKIKKILIVSGKQSHKNDLIRYAELKLAPFFHNMITNQKANCTDFRSVALFQKGAVDINFRNSTQIIVQCIRIQFIKKHPNWILIREITIRGDTV